MSRTRAAMQRQRAVRAAAMLGVLVPLACGDSRGETLDPGGLSLGSGGADDEGSSGEPGDGDDDDDTGAAPSDPPPEVQPAPGGLRRLRADQYTKSVRVLLGFAAEAVAVPPQDAALAGFDAVGATELALPPTAIEQYEASAIDIGAAVIADPGTLGQTVPCIAAGPHDAACYVSLARDFGALAWRRELSDAEAGAIVDVANAARAWADGDFWRGVQYGVATILQSPDFIYVVELGEEDDSELGFRLTDRELVTRMALFALGRVPDAALLTKADAGELATEEGLRAVAEEMVEHPDARTAMLRFFDELLRVRELPLRTKDAALFPAYSTELAQSMRDEALLLVNEVVLVQNASYLDLFSTDFTFVDPRLAEHYGLPAPASTAFEKVDLPAGQGRVGLLGTASFSALFSHPDQTSPTRRGAFIQRTLLCTEVPPPPADVDATLPELEDPTTLREYLEQHAVNPECAACHTMTDPIGFAFESFDATGAFRTLDNGFPIDTTGNAPGIGEFADSAELSGLLREHPGLATCLVRNLYRHAIGHLDGPDQADAMAWLADAFVDNGHDVKGVVVELMVNPVFRRVGEAK